jgi:hypothetical protein
VFAEPPLQNGGGSALPGAECHSTVTLDGRESRAMRVARYGSDRGSGR